MKDLDRFKKEFEKEDDIDKDNISAHTDSRINRRTREIIVNIIEKAQNWQKRYMIFIDNMLSS